MEYYDGCDQKLDNVVNLYYNVCSYPAGTLVTIKKIKDLKFSGNHPNGIDEGYINSGKLFAPIAIALLSAEPSFTVSCLPFRSIFISLSIIMLLFTVTSEANFISEAAAIAAFNSAPLEILLGSMDLIS